MSAEERIALMEKHAAAWNAHDIDGLLGMMTEDCVFEASAGPYAHGQRHAGHEALRAAFSAILQAFPDARWGDLVHTIAGDRGLSVWTFWGIGLDGRKVEARGLDLLDFRGSKISRKDTFRKNVNPQ